MNETKEFKGKKAEVAIDLEKIPDDGRPNSFSITVPDKGKIEIIGSSEFVTTVFRQILEHPESIVSRELLASYELLPKSEQKKFRRFFKIGEFAESEAAYWPAFLGEDEPA